MSDRVKQVLKVQIKVDLAYLKYLRKDAVAIPELAGVIPADQAELSGKLEDALAGHEASPATD